MITIFLSKELLYKELIEATDNYLEKALYRGGALFCFDGMNYSFRNELNQLHPSALRQRAVDILYPAVRYAEREWRLVWPQTGARKWSDLNRLLDTRGLRPISSTVGACVPECVAAGVQLDGLDYRVHGSELWP